MADGAGRTPEMTESLGRTWCVRGASVLIRVGRARSRQREIIAVESVANQGVSQGDAAPASPQTQNIYIPV